MADPQTAILIASGFVLGLAHAFEVDHMTAVAAFLSGRPRLKEAFGFGARWALGHGVSLLVLGSALFLARAAMPDMVAHGFEKLVGLALLALGARTLVRLWFRREVPHQHRHGVFWMGILHGIAGTAAFAGQALVAVAHSYALVAWYTLSFSAGVLVAMSIFAGAMSQMMSWGARLRSVGFQRVQAVVALWSCLVGVAWLVR